MQFCTCAFCRKCLRIISMCSISAFPSHHSETFFKGQHVMSSLCVCIADSPAQSNYRINAAAAAAVKGLVVFCIWPKDRRSCIRIPFWFQSTLQSLVVRTARGEDLSPMWSGQFCSLISAAPFYCKRVKMLQLVILRCACWVSLDSSFGSVWWLVTVYTSLFRKAAHVLL